MIKKINRLKKFGIYKDFSWNDLDNFKQKNLIYGWNYSGKTTLSKLFQSLEFRDKTKYFSNAEFSLTIEKNNTETIHTQDNLGNFPYDIKVFNANYIKRVFTFDLPNSDIQPISFYLGDPSGELDEKIKKLNKKISQLENIRDNRYQKTINQFSDYNKKNGKFTSKAKEIRENYLDNKLDQNNLNKAKVKQITDKIKSDLSKYILSETEKEKTKSKAITENTFELQKEDFSFSEKLETLANKVKSILEDSAPMSIPLPELDKNKTLFNWVQSGIKLHENETDCKFCTNILPKNRINNLNLYYSEKLQEIQSEISSIQQELKEENDKIKIQFPHKRTLEKSYQSDYEKSITNYNKTVEQYKDKLTLLEKDLKRKTSNYFNNIPATEIEIITLKCEFDNIQKSIKAHNKWLNKFDDNKAKSIREILNHYIAEYLQIEDYNLKESNNNKSAKIILNINSKILINTNEKLKLETQLKSSLKGQEELNSILEILLHRNDIRIEIKENKFTLERNGHLANNLSEGEKSAIAFAYFLTELKSLRDDEPPKLYKTIVFIDDPISSLDSNHIFQVRLLLHNFFKTADFAQLFISTHNFEFLSVMLDTRLFGTIKKNTKENKRPLYFIKRKDDNTSLIKKLPSSFSSYKSEYVGLFHTIKEFNDLTNKEDFQNLLILPNAVRRFLELYTLMKYPSHSEIDNRVKQVFNPEDKPLYNTKLLHWFSHQNQFEKVQQHDDKILQIEDAISELLEYIETKDNIHWKGLNGE